MKRSTSLRTLLAILGASVLTLLAGCGREEIGSQAEPQNAKAAAKPVEDLQPEREIVVTANDLMKFSVTEIVASPGEVIKLTLNNIGTMPKFSMGHNLVIIGQEVDPVDFAVAGSTAPTSDYVPQDRLDEVVAHTALLGGGESDSIVFKVPSEKGTYPFLCSFPGHVQAGMKGTMRVQ